MVLLSAQGVRVDQDQVPTVVGLDVQAEGPHLLVLGAPRALFLAAAGVLPCRGGRLRIAGLNPLEALRSGHLSAAIELGATPPDWTTLDWIEWSLRLQGMPARHARLRALQTLSRFDLGDHGGVRLRLAQPPLRAVLPVMAAVASEAPTVLFDDPLAALDAQTARDFARKLARELRERSWIAFLPRLSLDSPLAVEADEALLFEGHELIAQGAPAELAAAERRYLVRVVGDGRALGEAITRRGGNLQGHRLQAGMAELTVDLDDKLAALDLFTMADELNQAIVELVPVGGKLW